MGADTQTHGSPGLTSTEHFTSGWGKAAAGSPAPLPSPPQPAGQGQPPNTWCLCQSRLQATTCLDRKLEKLQGWRFRPSPSPSPGELPGFPRASPRSLPRNSSGSTMGPASGTCPGRGVEERPPQPLPPLPAFSASLGPPGPHHLSQGTVRPAARPGYPSAPHRCAFAHFCLGRTEPLRAELPNALPSGLAPGEEPRRLLAPRGGLATLFTPWKASASPRDSPFPEWPWRKVNN